MKRVTLNKFGIFVYSQRKKRKKKKKGTLLKPIVPFVTHHPSPFAPLFSLILRLGPLSFPSPFTLVTHPYHKENNTAQKCRTTLL